MFPLVYVRGYEAQSVFNVLPSGGFHTAVADPYRGLNEGTSLARVTNDPDSLDQARLVEDVFPGPLLQLMHDEGYADALSFGLVDPQNVPSQAGVAAWQVRLRQQGGGRSADEAWRRTVWVYDVYKDDAMAGQRLDIRDHALGLARFLQQIRVACGSPAGFKVNLLAHSRGGLICRCYLQYTGDWQGRPFEALVGDAVPVAKLVTLGTPHQGIFMGDVNVPFGLDFSPDFSQERMADYLSVPRDRLHYLSPDGPDAPTARGGLTAERCLCVVGTNHQDYPNAAARALVGAYPNDGLVQCRHAFIKRAPRVFVHCAHSGPQGLVNHRLTYENLVRFLFGDLQAQLALAPVSFSAQQAEALRERFRVADTASLSALRLEASVAPRGFAPGQYLSRYRTEDGYPLSVSLAASSLPVAEEPSPSEGGGLSIESLIPLMTRWREAATGVAQAVGGVPTQKPVTLFHLFLNSRRGRVVQEAGETLREILYSVKIRLTPEFNDGHGESLPGLALFEDTLAVRVLLSATGASGTAWWGTASEPVTLTVGAEAETTIPLPGTLGRWVTCEGLHLTVARWV